MKQVINFGAGKIGIGSGITPTGAGSLRLGTIDVTPLGCVPISVKETLVEMTFPAVESIDLMIKSLEHIKVLMTYE